MHRDEKYLNFIRSKPCLICGAPAQAHHEALSGRGVGIKGSDYETIPLCSFCHQMRHHKGKKNFSNFYGIDYKTEITKLNKEYGINHETK